MLYYVGTAVFSPSIFGKQVVTDIFVRRFDALTFSKFSESVKSAFVDEGCFALPC